MKRRVATPISMTPDDIITYGKAIKRPVTIDKAVIAYFQEKFGTVDSEYKVGYAMTSFIWFSVAKKVVEAAAEIYELQPEELEALKRVYLRPGDYSIETD
jgi:hypothetical protein